MDVRCDRCGTDYEFDDTLISDRGTNVRCTQCGHAFRVFPLETRGVPEVWAVRTRRGDNLEFTSLKELQRAIAERRVHPDDLLWRGQEAPRPIADIAELEAFFASEAQPEPPAETTEGRRRGMTRPLGSEVQVEADVPEPPAPEPVRSEPVRSEPPRGSAAPGRVSSRHSAAAPSERPSSVPVQPSASRDSIPDDDASVESRYLPQRGAEVRWIAGLVLVGLAVLLGGTVGRKYIARFASVTQQGAETRDRRVSDLVEQSRRELDDGAVQAADRSLLEASALAERDVGVLAERARLETVRADLAWLELRLIDPAAGERVAAARRALTEQGDRAAASLSRAEKAGVEPRQLARHRVDVARIRGDLSSARRLVGPVAAHAHLPENAYTLAALDLADPSPVWSSVLDRLRLSSARYREAGRARSALIYALVRAGQHEQARLELGKLQGLDRPLLPELGEFVRREAPEPAQDAGAAPPASAAPAPAPAPTVESGSTTVVDFRAQLREGGKALARNELTRAETAFRAVLAVQPDNTEALTGLADVANRRGQTAAAASLYDRVLAKNPSYLPALLARADQKWAASDREGAAALYRRVLQQAGPDSSYGARAMQRLNQSEAPSVPAPADAGSEP